VAKHAIDDLAVIISASTEQLAGDLRAAARMFADFQKDVAKANGSVASQKMEFAGLKAMTAGIKGVTAHAKDAALSVAGIAAKTAVATATFGAMQAAGMGIGASFQQAKDSVNMAADLEQTTLAFEVMLKSADGAKKMLGEIRQFAATTPFNSKELTESARMLVAYGTTADQVIPTLRMLGDVSAGMGKDLPIRDLTYLYGTLQAQGRAYTKDINQFTNRGVDVLPNLSKELNVTTAEVMKLVEEGRVGFPEVVKAFKAMTAEGGRFHDMTKRQSQTFAGLRESAFDALDLIKTKFGQVVIEEFGLKDAARDFDKFAKDVIANVDRVRPAVRLVGDAVKGIVQISYELGRAGTESLGLWVEQARAAFPELGRAADSFREVISGLQNFKFDNRAVTRFAIDAGRLVLETAAVAIDATKGFAEKFHENWVKPIVGGIKDIKAALDTVGAGWKIIGNAATPNQGQVADPFGPPVPGEKPEAILARYKLIRDQMEMFRKRAADSGGADQDAIHGVLNMRHRSMNFLKPFGDSWGEQNAAHAALAAGKVPELKGAQADTADWLRGIKNTLDGFESAALKRLEEREADAYHAEVVANSAALEKSFQAEMAAADAGRKAAEVLRGALDPAAGAVTALGVAAAHLDESFGGLASNFWRSAVSDLRGQIRGEVRVPGGPSTQLLEFVNTAKDDFDPMRKLQQDKKLLDQAAQFNLLGRDQIDAAWTRKVRAAAGHLGVGGPPQLADAVSVGSAEDARLLARHQVGGGPVKTEDLLQQLLEVAKQQLRMDANANRHGVRILGIEF
jgi:hypothetical protein